VSGWSFLSFRGGLDWLLGAMPIVPNVEAEFGVAVIEKGFFFFCCFCIVGDIIDFGVFFPFLQLY